MAQDRKKQVSGEIPFHFMQEMGHSPRAMEQFFDLLLRTVLTAFPARTAVLCGAAVLLYSPKYAVLTSFISNRFSLR